MKISYLLCILLLAIAVPPLAAAKKSDRPVELLYHVDAVTLAEKAEGLLPYSLKGDTVRLDMNGVTMQVRPLSESARSTYFLLRSRMRSDPFPPLVKFPEGFTVFEVSFLNNTNEQFQFLPGMASLVRGKEGKGLKEVFAMGIGDLYGYFSSLFNGDELKIQMAMEPIFFKTVYLGPGERTTKLLVFEGLSKRTKKIGLNLDFLYLGSETQNILIPYLAEAVER